MFLCGQILKSSLSFSKSILLRSHVLPDYVIRNFVALSFKPCD